ncbi:hypothetical protein BaRGS_00005084 [Batillaria attramentaria]|uniref:Ribosomal protein S3 n=1 Tax=Batillaria attramentaria TaxID=370345 RepID=A0ABD0LVM6_9CAEN
MLVSASLWRDQVGVRNDRERVSLRDYREQAAKGGHPGSSPGVQALGLLRSIRFLITKSTGINQKTIIMSTKGEVTAGNLFAENRKTKDVRNLSSSFYHNTATNQRNTRFITSAKYGITFPWLDREKAIKTFNTGSRLRWYSKHTADHVLKPQKINIRIVFIVKIGSNGSASHPARTEIALQSPITASVVTEPGRDSLWLTSSMLRQQLLGNPITRLVFKLSEKGSRVKTEQSF